MPPRYLRRASPTRLKHCQERTFEACETASTDQCCGVIPCKLCIEFQTSYDTYQSSATFGSSSWTGTLNSISFVAFWERSASDVCEFVVYFGGYEVYRASCYDGASCRNPSGEASVTVGTESGTLSWSVYEPRELELIDDPDTGCRDFFCGSCRCSCECICVKITEYGGRVIRGELCDIAYDCDPPTWAGVVGYYDLSFTLGRDRYGECIITPSVDGDELDSVAAGGCGSMSASITTAGGDLIEISCKQCVCEQAEQDVCIPCPPGTIYPWAVSVTFTELGISADSGNQFDEDQDGETIFNYPVEGDYGGYTIQANFGECDASVAISLGGVSICTFSGSTGSGLSMEAVDCPGDTLTLIYTITCENGSTLTVVISG